MAEKHELKDFPNIVSVDDHIVEPPTLWRERLPKRYLDVGPRVVREQIEMPTLHNAVASADPEMVWVDTWLLEEQRVPMQRAFASVGYAPPEVETVPMTFDEMRPGCYDVAARLADMDVNGVDASLCFPNLFVRFCGQRFLACADKDLALLCVQAYNDWVIEEWSGKSDGRLVGAGIIPLWDPVAAASEVRRNASRGLKVVSFSEIPAYLGLPSIYDESWLPFFEACNETSTLVCMHIGSASTLLTTSDDAPLAVPVANDYVKSSLSLTDWLLSGLFVRFPNIKVSYSEGQAGWMPYIVERLDGMWRQGNGYNEVRSRLPETPSHYFREHVYSCIFDDPVAIRLIDSLPKDKICFETDYPHPDGTWPESRKVAMENLRGLSPEMVERVVRGNAIEMLGLDEAKLARSVLAAPAS